MQTIRSTGALVRWRRSLQQEGVTIGLVPTMGALHAGHLSLIRKARLACDAVLVSVFVNPRQFAHGEDFSRYPRQLQADAACCRREGVDVLFAPTIETVYPVGFETFVVVEDLSRRWEGPLRPTHFGGVTTIMTKLLTLTQPDFAFFGQKDYQQTMIVKRLVADLNFDTRVIMCPTIREQDGLAMSSRNEYLSPAGRRAAPILYAALQAGRRAVEGGVSTAGRIRAVMHRVIRKEPLVKVDYLAACDRRTLNPVGRITKPVVLLGAIRIQEVRLIDNVLASPSGRRNLR